MTITEIFTLLQKFRESGFFYITGKKYTLLEMISRNIFEVSVFVFANSVQNCSVNQFHEISIIHSKIIIFPNCGNKTFFQKFREIIFFSLYEENEI